MKTSLRATLIGMIAILMWALLALLTAASGRVPPFQLVSICFAMASVIGMMVVWKSGDGLHVFRQPVAVWCLGVGGLFGYHFFYFTALRHAPPVEAGLIAYLWPLLIILFSALLPGEHLKRHHLIGGLLGLLGAYLIVSGGDGGEAGIDSQTARAGEAVGFPLLGYVAAGLCAVIWSAYSVLSRRFAEVPSQVVTGFCAASCVLALIAHLVLETTVWPTSTGQWLALLGLGLGPVGLAFYVWDYGVKKGNIQVLGAASYSAPVLSTLALIAAGFAQFSWTIAAAAILVTLGAVVAAKDMIFKS